MFVSNFLFKVFNVRSDSKVKGKGTLFEEKDDRQVEQISSLDYFLLID